MIDYFALALAHGLIALAVIRMLGNDALDRDPDLAGDGDAEPARKRDRQGGARPQRGKRKRGRRA